MHAQCLHALVHHARPGVEFRMRHVIKLPVSSCNSKNIYDNAMFLPISKARDRHSDSKTNGQEQYLVLWDITQML